MTEPKPLRAGRRQFLKSAAGAAAAPFILPSHIWAADVKPNDKIVMGFIGTGKQGLYLMNTFLGKKEVQAVAVCDVDTSRREEAQRRVNAKTAGCEAYVDYKELLDRKDIDAVCIATPDHWHTAPSVAAVRAGKDVYCEKPLTHTAHESVVIMDEVHKAKRILQTGSMQRSMAEFRVACELVQNGVIGEIDRVECSFGPPPVACDLPEEAMEPGLDWDRWLGPAPKRPYNSVLSPRGVHNHFPNWRNYREYGGGMVCDWGAHHLDIAQWALGMDDSGPVEIIPPDNAEKAKDGGVLRYANGIEVTHKNGNGVVFYGKKNGGKVVVNRGRFELWWGDEREFVSTNQLGQAEEKYLKDAKVRLYKSGDHKSDFLDCTKSRKQPICHVDIGARTALCCHLLNIAYLHGKALKWDPAKNQFQPGGGDAAWLTKDYREGYGIA